MITLEQLSLSLALGLILAFVAGAGFGVWLTLRTMTRIYTQNSKPVVSDFKKYFPSLTDSQVEQLEEIRRNIKPTTLPPMTDPLTNNLKPVDTGQEVDPMQRPRPMLFPTGSIGERPLPEGYVRKGGRNPTAQIKKRPPVPGRIPKPNRTPP